MISIRSGIKKDLPELLELIKELAEFENAPDQVTNTIERMETDGFSSTPIFGFIVAENNETLIGASIYYYRYSTWKGKRLYLEDIIVTENYRGKGVGTQLFERTAAIARGTGCTGMMWQVLDWNKDAINFYKKYNAVFDNEWINCSIDF